MGGRRVISCRAFPNKRGQFRLGKEDGFSALVFWQALPKKTADRVAAQINGFFCL